MHLISPMLLSAAASALLLVHGSPAPTTGGIASFPGSTNKENGKLVRVPVKWGKRPSGYSIASRKRDPAPLFNMGGGPMLVEVEIGTPAQNFTLEIDTGSADLWVPTTECPPEDSPFFVRFDTNASSTFEPIHGADFDISYMDGTMLNGTYATDTVTIGNLSVQHQQLGVITSVYAPPDLLISGGILGLGYPGLTSAASKSNKPYNPFFFNLVEQNLISEHVFSVYMNSGDKEGLSGELILGGIDNSKYTGELKYSNVLPVPKRVNASDPSLPPTTIRQYSHWWSRAIGMSVSHPRTDGAVGITFNVTSEADPLLFVWDTDSTMTVLPKAIATTMADALVGSGNYVLDKEKGFFKVNCSLKNNSASNRDDASSPALVLTVPEANKKAHDQTFNISVPLSKLIFSEDNDSCVLGIRGMDTSSRTIVVGGTVLRSQYVVFDVANNQVGFANAVV